MPANGYPVVTRMQGGFMFRIQHAVLFHLPALFTKVYTFIPPENHFTGSYSPDLFFLKVMVLCP